MPEVDESEFLEDTGLEDESYVEDKVKLSRMMSEMSDDDKAMLMKCVHFDLIRDLLSAVKNLKKTGADVWKNLIARMNVLKGIETRDKSGFDFNALLDILIPAVGALSATLLALRESERANIEANTLSPEDNPLLNDPSLKKDSNELFEKSVILRMCKTETNGYSL